MRQDAPFWVLNGTSAPLPPLQKIFNQKSHVYNFLALLVPFIVQNLQKNSPSQSTVMRMGRFWVQNGPFAPNNNFFVKSLILFSSTYWPLSLCKILKNSYNGSRVKMCHFWNQHEPICPNDFFFSENLLINLVLIIYLPRETTKEVSDQT